MTLHIALDGISGTGKTTMIKKLSEFLTKKSYNVKSLIQPQDKTILYILNNYNLTISEIALLMALDRSLTWNYEDFKDYDIVLWDRCILSDYAYHTDEDVKASFIRNINKYFPDMDIYIVIHSEEILQDRDYINQCKVIQKYDVLIDGYLNIHKVDYIPGDPEKVFDDIVETIFTVLPTCKWCGRLFKKSVSNKKYCCLKCKNYAKEEQNRNNFRNFYNRYKDTMSESKKGALGSKGANLHGRANSDPKVELKLINNEKRRLGI